MGTASLQKQCSGPICGFAIADTLSPPRTSPRRALSSLTPEQLQLVACRQLRLVSEADPWAADPTFLMELLVATYERRRSQREVVNEMPLYPTEGLLWDESQVGRVWGWRAGGRGESAAVWSTARWCGCRRYTREGKESRKDCKGGGVHARRCGAARLRSRVGARMRGFMLEL